MEVISVNKVQTIIDLLAKQPVYIHLETTNGAYATHRDESFFSANAFIRNALLQYEHGKITGDGPFRCGLKLDFGWVYADGLTHYEVEGENTLLLAGQDHSGKLAIALQLSRTPFP